MFSYIKKLRRINKYVFVKIKRGSRHSSQWKTRLQTSMVQLVLYIYTQVAKISRFALCCYFCTSISYSKYS